MNILNQNTYLMRVEMYMNPFFKVIIVLTLVHSGKFSTCDLLLYFVAFKAVEACLLTSVIISLNGASSYWLDSWGSVSGRGIGIFFHPTATSRTNVGVTHMSLSVHT